MSDIATLDVRDTLRGGGEPLQDILRFTDSLPEGTTWRLLATFEPIPLLRLMEKRGFSHEAARLESGDWEVLFRPGGRGGAAREKRAPAAAGAPARPKRSLDNRGLLPPEPMVRVLEALGDLGAGEVLEVWNDRVPVFLMPELEERGYAATTEEIAGEGVRLLIWRTSS